MTPTLRSAVAITVIGLGSMMLFQLVSARSARVVVVPAPAVDEPRAASASSESIVLAGGCFWGIQDVFDHVKGVQSTMAGYSGGDANAPTYELVSTGTTGHAESVRVTYDPSQVTLGTLLSVFFSVAHDPTELNRQGPDHGTQYRSAIFTSGEEQARVANAYIAQLAAAHVYGAPIVTQVTPLKAFYQAEAYHQGYAASHPYMPYIAINDAPKVRRLKSAMAGLYRD